MSISEKLKLKSSKSSNFWSDIYVVVAGAATGIGAFFFTNSVPVEEVSAAVTELLIQVKTVGIAALFSGGIKVINIIYHLFKED